MKKFLVLGLVFLSTTSFAKYSDEKAIRECRLIEIQSEILEKDQINDACKYIYRSHINPQIRKGCNSIIKSDRENAIEYLENSELYIKVIPRKNECLKNDEAELTGENIKKLINNL